MIDYDFQDLMITTKNIISSFPHVFSGNPEKIKYNSL